MSQRTTHSVGIILSRDFPLDAYNSVHTQVKLARLRSKKKRSEFGRAWNAVAYRYKAMTEHDSNFRSQLQRFGTSPPPFQRYRQENELFGFFICGQSILESIAYASVSLASALVPSHFPMDTQGDLRKINLRYTSCKFRSSSYSSDTISRKFDQLERSRAWDNWSKIRNILIHRQQPTRSFSSENDTWHDKFVIDARITKNNRVWVSQVTQGLVSALDDFCSKYLQMHKKLTIIKNDPKKTI